MVSTTSVPASLRQKVAVALLTPKLSGDSGVLAIPEHVSAPKRILSTLLAHGLMLVLCLVCLLPFYAMIVTALKSTAEFQSQFGALSPPASPTLSKFIDAWSELNFATLVKNSALLSLVSAALVTAISAPAGFALARVKMPGQRAFIAGCVGLMAVPAMVVVLPLFALFSSMGLVNRYPSAIIAEVGINLPFAIYLMYTFMRDIPEDVFKAAEIDGASIVRQFFSIALPLSRPVLATASLVTAIYVWNDLLVPLILWQGESLGTLMVGLANLAPGRAGAVDIPLVMAGVTISVMPVVVLFIAMQRLLVRGLAEGSSK